MNVIYYIFFMYFPFFAQYIGTIVEYTMAD